MIMTEAAEADPRAASDERGAGPGTRARLNVPCEQPPAVFSGRDAQTLLAMLDRLAPTDASLLIVGETGTGKEMAARYIHAQSRRRAGPFLAVNCGALSETLAEAELFGHEKGAFTGAVRAQRGWFEAASGGTLLLDEIGDLPLALQVKLLRVLQEREVTRLGSRAATKVDVRVIAATNVDLQAAIAQKRFREDLYFRLNVATITLPPLRERRDALPVLVEHFVKLYGDRLGRPKIRVAAGALVRLAAHPWPGNIRELENVIHNAVLLTQSEVIESGHLNLLPAPEIFVSAAPFEVSLPKLFEQAMQQGRKNLLVRTERLLVQAALDQAAGNQLRAAAFLGISRNKLRTRMVQMGLLRPRRRGPAAPKNDPTPTMVEATFRFSETASGGRLTNA
jgi:DNA-binding NtrC family response regulator